MNAISAAITRSSVLAGALGGDPRFARIYAPLVLAMARRCGLMQDAAEDVAQQVLLEALQWLQKRAYDSSRGSFKGLLKVMVRRRALDRRMVNVSLDGDVPVPTDDPIAAFDEAFEQQWRFAQVREKLEEVRLEFQPTTYRCFELMVVEERSSLEVARMLGLQEAAVRKNKSRVLKALRDRLGAEDASRE